MSIAGVCVRYFTIRLLRIASFVSLQLCENTLVTFTESVWSVMIMEIWRPGLAGQNVAAVPLVPQHIVDPALRPSGVRLTVYLTSTRRRRSASSTNATTNKAKAASGLYIPAPPVCYYDVCLSATYGFIRVFSWNQNEEQQLIVPYHILDLFFHS